MTRPALFSELELDAALERTAREKTWLLVDATASWCQPCKTMDRTTWSDAAVADAIRGRGIAIQLDVDERKEESQRLRIRAMPTVVAFRAGVEVDRVVGLQSPGDLRAWLDALERGETSVERARATARAAPADMKVRMALARKLVSADELDAATTEYVWLWEHMAEGGPVFAALRHSFLLQEVRDLIARHTPARDAFTRVRDAARVGTLDWITLCTALGDEARTFTWFDSIRSELAGNAELAELVEHQIAPLLQRAGRWADAGAAFVDPIATARRALAQLGAMDPSKIPEEAREEMTRRVTALFVSELTALRRSLNAARRDDALAAVDELVARTNRDWLAPLSAPGQADPLESGR